jgi:hypothetical protein
MRRHCAELVTIARLTVDHIPHGRATHRADYLIVYNHRKDVVSATPTTAPSPIGKRRNTIEDRCNETEEMIVPNAIRMAN